jgi:hypothetical protein
LEKEREIDPSKINDRKVMSIIFRVLKHRLSTECSAKKFQMQYTSRPEIRSDQNSTSDQANQPDNRSFTHEQY